MIGERSFSVILAFARLFACATRDDRLNFSSESWKDWG